MYSYIYIHIRCTHISGVNPTSQKNQLVQSTCPACGWHHDSFWQTSLLGQNNMEQHLLSFSLYFLSLFILSYISYYISLYIDISCMILYFICPSMIKNNYTILLFIIYIFLHYLTYLIYYA